MQISDKLKAIAAAIGTFGTAVAVAAEDSTVTLTEAGAIAIAAFGVGAAVWAVRNRQPA